MSNRRRLILPGTREHDRIMGASTVGRLILPGGAGGGKQLVRNAQGNPLPCCYADCWEDGDNRTRVEVPHTQPKHPGEKLVYIFCTDAHKSLHLKGTVYADR